MRVQSKDLWSLALGCQCVDPQDLAEAIEDQVVSGDLDYRSRLLIRDSIKALRHHWGSERVADWLNACPVGGTVEAICNQQFECNRGFSSLMDRVVDVTRAETIRQFLRELGTAISRPVRLDIGGSASLILTDRLYWKTEDIDVVDEVPAEVRSQRKLLAELHQRYGLELAHFQRHYLPMGWEQRVHSQAPFGRLQVYLVDVYDVALSKVFSGRTKDLDHLRQLIPQLEKDTLVRKLKETTQSMLATPDLRANAEHNWYILFGEPLPS